jgi:hypothetical protein
LKHHLALALRTQVLLEQQRLLLIRLHQHQWQEYPPFSEASGDTGGG